MNILAISDWYGFDDAKVLRGIAALNVVDVVVSLGDLTPDFYADAGQVFPDTPKLAVMGNHDDSRFAPQYALKSGFKHLHLAAAEIGGLTFAGFDGSIRYKDGDGFMWTQEEAAELAKSLPPAHVLIAHSPPYSVYHPANDPAHAGLQALDAYIQQCRPQLVLCGHLHCRRTWLIAEMQVEAIFGLKLFSFEPAQSPGSRLTQLLSEGLSFCP